MTNSKLITLLKTLNTSEWRRLGEFLASPFFNKNKELISLYQYLKKIEPDFSEKKLNKKVVFAKVYSQQPFQARILEDLMYNLLKQSEHFLRMIQLEQKEFTKNLLMLEILLERKLDKHYRVYRKETEKILEKGTSPISDYFLFKYQLSNLATKRFQSQNQSFPLLWE